QVAASSGCQVIMVDISSAALDKGLATISTSLDRLIKKEVLKPDDKSKILSRVKTSTKTSDFAQCEVVIEAVTENIDLKLKI
ncbi:3-hydroxyacyl-CoA dehydrogenase NAD-binding domain-containing protein, partial [Pseudomonas aeruginosa]